MSEIITDTITYLENFKSTEDNLYTHVSMGNIKRSYCILRDEKENFWNLYLDDINENKKLCLAERPQENIILYFDFDIKKKIKEKEKPKCLFKSSCVKSVIGIIQNIIRKYILNLKEYEYTCVLLQKKPYIIKTSEGIKCSSGFHLHFPYIGLNKRDIQTYIYNETNNECKKLNGRNELFIGLKYGDENDAEVKLDMNVVNTCWLMYGSSKNENSDPYLYFKCYNGKQKEKSISLWGAFKNYVLLDTRDHKIELTEDDIEYYLPRIMSIIPKIHLCRTIQKHSIDITKDIFEKAERYSKRFVETTEITDKDILDIRQLLDMLSYDRSTNYSDWIQIGSLLYNLSLQISGDEGSDEIKTLWHEFSRKCGDKYDEEGCNDKWNSFKKNNYTIGSLHFFASNDNPIAYKEFKNEKVNIMIDKIALFGTQRDIATVLHKMFNQEFTCADIKTRCWYHYRDHHWVDDQEGRTLRNYMSEKLKERYQSIIAKLYNKVSETSDREEKERVEQKIKHVNKIIHNLGTNTFKNGVLKECADIFYDENFYNQLDHNPHIIGFKNGVYDLKTGELRDGRPDDYISKFIPHEYKEFTFDDPIVKELLDIIKKIFPDEDLRIYFMNTTCEFFEGFNKRKLVLVWSGEGHNGKSVCMKILEYSLGKFVIKGPTTLITGKKPPSGQACPELSRSTGARVMSFDEPNKKEVINGGMLKLLSGGDSFFARGLFKDGDEIEPFFKIVIVCNDKPKTDAEDKALFNRIRVLPFESTFTDNCPSSESEQYKQKKFPRDNDLLEWKYKLFAQAFNWLMLENYKRLRKNPSEAKFEPHKVLFATEQYRKDNDIFSQFIYEHIIEDKKSIISIKPMFEVYREWFKSSYPGNPVCSRPEFQEYFIKKWGKPLPMIKWSGYRIRNDEDDEIEFTINGNRNSSDNNNKGKSKSKCSIVEIDDLESVKKLKFDDDEIKSIYESDEEEESESEEEIVIKIDPKKMGKGKLSNSDKSSCRSNYSKYSK